jgi:hypothetical protein
MHLRRAVFFTACLLGYLANAFADDTHYQDYIIGGRALGLGGAFTALSNDPSGIYLNPAGIVDISRSNLQFSTSLYGFEKSAIASRPDVPIPGIDVQVADLIVVPASAGSIQTFGDKIDGQPQNAWGFSLVVPSFRSYSSAADEPTRYKRNVQDRELWSGIGYARRMGERLRLGISGFYVFRTVQDREDVNTWEDLGDGVRSQFSRVSNDVSISSGAIVFILGGKYHLGNGLTLGASLRPPSFVVHSNAKLGFTRSESDPNNNISSFETVSISGRSHVTYPANVRLGIAYERRLKYTLSLDLTYYAPVNYELITNVSQEARSRLPFNPQVTRGSVANVNLGGEYLVIREVSIAAGFFTDFSSAPQIRPLPTRDQSPYVNLIGFTLALGYFGEHTLSRIGFLYSFGKGYDVIPQGGRNVDQVLGTATQKFDRVSYQQSFLYVFLSSSFRY